MKNPNPNQNTNYPIGSLNPVDSATWPIPTDEPTILSPNQSILTQNELKFVDALLTTSTLREAAALAGIGERTAYTYLRSTDVQAVLAEVQGSSFKHLAARLINAGASALDVLIELATDKTVPASVRSRSASAILDLRLRSEELINIESRIAFIAQIQSFD